MPHSSVVSGIIVRPPFGVLAVARVRAVAINSRSKQRRLGLTPQPLGRSDFLPWATAFVIDDEATHKMAIDADCIDRL